MALKHEICPFARCDLSKGACEHLEYHVGYDKSERLIQPQMMFIDDIDDKPMPPKEGEPGEIWALFKKLRGFGLDNDQVGILIRRFGYDMTHRQIMEDMHYTSFRLFNVRLNQALDTLKKRGFR